MKGRLRFAGFKLERLPSGECRARVTLIWPERDPYKGEAQGLASQAGELRCAAQACLNAITQAVPEPAFELVGVKAIRAFDSAVVIVSLSVVGTTTSPRIVGSYLTEGDQAKGAALAVLNATNRLLHREGRLRG